MSSKNSEQSNPRTEYERGVLAAAGVAATYNSSTTHEYRLDDCSAYKLNVGKRRQPRRNLQKIEDPDSMWTRGVAAAFASFAEMHQGLIDGSDPDGVQRVATACGLTIAYARRCGVPAYDLKRLRKAGIR